MVTKDKEKRFLATTALEEFWDTSKPILFLGEWCKLYNRKNSWSKLDFITAPYHWNDREKFFKDYLYLNSVYERNLAIISRLLNELLATDHTVRYWRMLIGPWLRYFIGVLYDRYLSIKTVFESQYILESWISKDQREMFLPLDYDEIISFSMSDEYNLHLYSRLIEYITDFHYSYKDIDDSSNIKPTKKSSAKDIIKKIFFALEKVIPSKLNRLVFVDSYFGISDLIKLQLSLRQLPYLFTVNTKPGKILPDASLRDRILINKAENEFESILNRLLPWQIPLVYLEGYKTMAKKSLEIFPKKPQAIFTANALYSNETFKFWAGFNVEQNKTKLLAYQHGGHYGCGLWSGMEDHEIEVSDRFYSWGWRPDNEAKQKTVPISSTKLLKTRKKLRPNPNGSILWALMSLPRYSYWLYSIPEGPQMSEYLNDQHRFARSVLKEVYELLILRLYPQEYGWNEADLWRELEPKLKIYQGSKPMHKQLVKSRLFIGTYNATTLLETFSADFPTVLFWNPNHWELRDSAKPYFDQLKKSMILHETPESAADLVNKIYKDPLSWWKRKETQKAKNLFCSRYAQLDHNNWLDEWKTELLGQLNG